MVDPYRVRFRLKEPWPDFMTFYAMPATGAGWVVPKKYVEKVGDEGFKKAPIGAGPYKLVSFKPGIEMVFDAHDKYWRKTPAVKRMIWKTVTEDLTRLAMLKRGEVDVAYSLRGPLGEEVKRTPGLKLMPTVIAGSQWFNFGMPQWDPKSPWHDKRVRLAAALAFDKNAINQAETLGHSKMTGAIIPAAFEYALAIPPYPYDPAAGEEAPGRGRLSERLRRGRVHLRRVVLDRRRGHRQLPGHRGYPDQAPADGARGFPRRLERQEDHRDLQAGAGGLGNAATRVQNYFVRDGIYAFGGYPDIDDLAIQQAREIDPKRREALLHQIQRLAHERVMHAPLWELGFLNAIGPRVEESGLSLIALHPYSAPYEDLKLKN